MSIEKIASNVQFGVSAPAYQSRSVGTDFEDIIKQIQKEVKAIEQQCQASLMNATNGLMSKDKNNMSAADYFLSQASGSSSLFSMKSSEFSLLDDLLMSALEETKMQQQLAGTDAAKLQDQVPDRFKFDAAKLSATVKPTIF